MVRYISSKENPIFKKLKKLNHKKHILQFGEFVLGGNKIIPEIIQNPEKANLCGWIVQKESEVPKTKKEYPVYCLSKKLWQELSFFLTPPPLALLSIPPLPFWENQKLPGITVFLPLQDPGNLGTALRSSAAFGIEQVVLLKEAALPFLPKAARGAGSSLFQIKLFRGPFLKEFLKNPPPNTYILDLDGQDIRGFKKPKNLNLVVGLEGLGFKVEDEFNLPKLTIPMAKYSQNSLNAAVALSIALFVLQEN